MPSLKPVLKTRVKDDVKIAFLAQARNQGLSEARLLEVLIDEFLHQNSSAPSSKPSPESRPVDSIKSKEVRIRLSPYEYNELENLAAQRNWKRSTYLAHLFQAHLSNQPRFSEEEMLVLRETTMQLSALGRNINQIARALNTSLDEAHQATVVSFDEIKGLLDIERACVKALIRANLKTWGVANDNG